MYAIRWRLAILALFICVALIFYVVPAKELYWRMGGGFVLALGLWLLWPVKDDKDEF